ncbi:MAG: PEP/pyruvate-binding domain-containing protein, partial [Candidatus Aminicenantaceae bacterium]
MTEKYVYFFAQNNAEGDRTMRDTLGGKGANLAEMAGIGLPVPPGFTVSTDVCSLYFEAGNQIPAEVEEQILANLRKLEETAGLTLGDEADPMLVSVRSGAKFSMPGMMDTVLNLGLNDATVEGLARKSGNRRFALDCYRRLIQMFSDVVLEVPKRKFEDKLKEMKAENDITNDFDISEDLWQETIAVFKGIVKQEAGVDFPQDVKEQLFMAVSAVFRSWHNPRAITYRRLNHISEDLGTAVNVQLMVFGNYG